MCTARQRSAKVCWYISSNSPPTPETPSVNSAASCSSQSGAGSTSESRAARNSVVLARMAVLRATARPRLRGWRMTRKG